LSSTSEPFSHSSGPRNARIAIVGDAWGEQEALTGMPFMGTSGQELTRMLLDAGISKRECFLTNVLNLRPPGNNVEALCAAKTIVGKEYSLPPLAAGKYLLPEHLHHVERLKAELLTVNPNLVLALGATACWALLAGAKLSAVRGTIAQGALTSHKVLPTFHPSFILRNWSQRAVAIADLRKAAREAEFPEIRRPKRSVLFSPTLEEIEAYATADHAILSVDIETTRGQMASIGFASTRDFAIVIPFITDEKVPRSFWPFASQEARALRAVKHLLERPIPKLFQNGLYDLQYIVPLGIRPWNTIHDTMLLHHSLYPELRKGLGFLGSLYTDEASWKILGGKTDSTKREE